MPVLKPPRGWTTPDWAQSSDIPHTDRDAVREALRTSLQTAVTGLDLPELKVDLYNSTDSICDLALLWHGGASYSTVLRHLDIDVEPARHLGPIVQASRSQRPRVQLRLHRQFRAYWKLVAGYDHLQRTTGQAPVRDDIYWHFDLADLDPVRAKVWANAAPHDTTVFEPETLEACWARLVPRVDALTRSL